LIFQSSNILTPIPLFSISNFKENKLDNILRVCTINLILQVSVLLEKSTDIDIKNFDLLFKSWEESLERWKQQGISTNCFESITDFLNKRNIVVDESIYLISPTVSECESNLTLSEDERINTKCKFIIKIN
jgi:hypothetical protein